MPGESKKDNGVAANDNEESCTSCHQYFDKEDACWGNYVPLTRDEEAILAQMRELKTKVTEAKKRLRELEGDTSFQPADGEGIEEAAKEEQAQWLELKQLVEMLREEWRRLDAKRQEAAAFRMKILGHED